ncbi:MAG: helix-turn-helix transcriptional regulator [Hyphomicrobiales bacterium]|nr:helix-turn-helix domain-containing protein [Hyphomicrobiales bacterium]MDE2018417.1 helix-turn-helix transcriptional regulator [Hyphomicrobiales bacterium]
MRALNAIELAIEPQALEGHAVRAAELMKSMSNKWRLLVLCSLVHGEKSVGELERRVGLGQSALSQHLAVLRRKELVATRRSAQTVYYRLSGLEVAAVLTTLYGLYCGTDAERCGVDAAGI